MNIALIGFELEGKSSYAYWSRKGANITICDQDPNKQTPAGAATQLGPEYLKDLDRFDLIVRSAGVPPMKLAEANPGVDLTAKTTTLIETFLRDCPTKNTIGVTGTKGKGTTSTLITKMLEAAGKRVFLAGNIGSSPLEFLDELTPDSWVVLELSSFQLSDIKVSTHIAVCLMMVPEHLNWHTDFDDYVHAKSNLFAHQTKDDIAVYFAPNKDSRRVVEPSPGTKIPYFEAPGAFVDDDKIVIDGQTICRVDELKLLGKHNWQNACAATTAVWQVTHDVAAIRSVLTSFSGLEHRIEFVREVAGVKYYDDSFSTTPETAIAALEAIPESKIIILGGSDKGIPFDELAAAVPKNNVRRVISIGQMGPVIAEKLRANGFDAITPGGDTMPAIVEAARAAAQSGDAVLLSTGCASFGMFKDYKERGDLFKQAVRAL